jgi:hypothetical protein
MSNLHDDFPECAQAREEAMLAEEAKARAELRDRFAIQIVGSLILRMPADNVITPAMCKTVWTIADAMLKERDQ